MRKTAVLIVLVAVIVASMAIFAGSASAAPNMNAYNQGTFTAHTYAIPSTGGLEVPGLSRSPFAGAEVRGHNHAPDSRM